MNARWWSLTITKNIHTDLYQISGIFFPPRFVTCHIVVWYSRWRHRMETFTALLSLCEGNPPGNSSHNDTTLMLILITWLTSWQLDRLNCQTIGRKRTRGLLSYYRVPEHRIHYSQLSNWLSHYGVHLYYFSTLGWFWWWKHLFMEDQISFVQCNNIGYDVDVHISLL